jgi:hypothetical protein
LSDETEAFPRQRSDEALLLAGIADRTPDDIQAGRQHCIRNDTSVPNGIDQLILADDALPVADRVIEQIERLRRNRNDLRPTMQLAQISVKGVILEEIAQAAISLAIPLRGLQSSGGYRHVSNAGKMIRL